MSRYVNEVPTSLSPQEIVAIATEYLRGEGFALKQRDGEEVWQKGEGWAVAPQFMKVVPGNGTAHVEAWHAGFALLPGVYFGEMDLTGAYGWAVKAALKPRVAEIERRLGGAAAPTAQPAAGWQADPTGRHEHRYWDGARWTDQVSDAGVASTDPV